jgi:hypothetical protein
MAMAMAMACMTSVGVPTAAWPVAVRMEGTVVVPMRVAHAEHVCLSIVEKRAHKSHPRLLGGGVLACRRREEGGEARKGWVHEFAGIERLERRREKGEAGKHALEQLQVGLGRGSNHYAAGD